jgi:hypothetical protein
MKKTIMIFLLLVLAACASDDQGPPPSADEQFKALAIDYIEGWMAFRPVYATMMGLHTHDTRLPDFSPRALKTEMARIDGFLKEVTAIPLGQLNPENLYDLEILTSAVRARRSRLTEAPDYKRDPLFYNDLIILGLECLLRRDFAPAAIRVESLLSRLSQIPTLLEVAQINLTQVPEILRNASEKPLVNTMHMLRDNLPGRIRDQMDGHLPEGFDEVHKEAVYAYTDYILFVKDHLRDHNSTPSGIGERLFLERWADEEAVDLISADAVLELCRTAREALLEQMNRRIRLVDPEATLSDVLARIEENHESVKGVTDRAADLVGDLKSFILEKDVVTLPEKADYSLRILDPDPRIHSLVSYLFPGYLDETCITGYAFINPLPPGCREEEEEVALRFFTPYSIALLTAGVAYPGTFVQTVKARDSGSVFRKVLHAATLTSGWAHYCEELVIEQGFDPRPEAFLTLFKMGLLEINRLEVSVRIHCLGMTEEDARTFLVEQSFITRCLAQREVIDITRNPKAGAGFVGKAQIQKLRDLYLSKDKSRKLKMFHDLLLSVGHAPVSVIANKVFGQKI